MKIIKYIVKQKIMVKKHISSTFCQRYQNNFQCNNSIEITKYICFLIQLYWRIVYRPKSSNQCVNMNDF